MATTSTNIENPQAFRVCIFNPEVDPAPSPELFKGFMCASDLVVWLGKEKHRKTNLLLQFAICAAVGMDFLTFRFIAQGPLRVVFIDYESKSGSLKFRYDSICRSLVLSEDQRRLLKENLQIIEVRQMRQEGCPFPRFPLSGDAEGEQVWKAFIAQYSADIYIVDPMRCFHSGDENDSKIENLFDRIRQFFGHSTVIISHHTRKRPNSKNDDRVQLSKPGCMRDWSDGSRGSGAIKAHADAIVCQERIIEGETEVVYLGAFMKDAPDIEPIPLVETDAESFLFRPSLLVPSYLRASFDALRDSGTFADQASAAKVLQNSGTRRSTAYRHVRQMIERGLMVRMETGLMVAQEIKAS